MKYPRIFQNSLYDCNFSDKLQKGRTVQTLTCVGWVLNHKLMQGFNTQTHSVHLAYNIEGFM